MCVRVGVCASVCVCEREGGRDREGRTWVRVMCKRVLGLLCSLLLFFAVLQGCHKMSTENYLTLQSEYILWFL